MQDHTSNIARIAAILKGFDNANTPRRTHEIIDSIGGSRSTGFGLLRAMTVAGWLERVDHGLLRLGPRSRALAFSGLEPPVKRGGRKLAVQRHSGEDAARPVAFEWDPRLVRVVETAGFRRPAPWRIGFSNASTGNAWRRALLESMSYARKIAQPQIAELIHLDAGDDPDRQCRQIDSLVEAGVDLLLVSVASVTDAALSARLRDLADGGLPIVAVDRRPNERGSLVSFVTASDHRIGRTSALWIAERLGGQGTVWMLSGLEGASPVLRRQQAALAIFSEFPGIRVENVSYTNWTEDGGHAAAAKLLAEAGQPPDAVWCDSGLQGVGSVRLFLEEGLPVPLHTGGDLNRMYKLCLHNKVPMAALDYPASMGARAIEVAIDVLCGVPVPQRVEVPVQVVLPRGQETASVKADLWAERHVAWDLGDDAILSQGPALRGGTVRQGRVAGS
ncbi:substrate-binding domain-containing protein [Mameliella alba]|nr:substrate-binding domain-containing protein [Antarctobacter heliothermus]MBY6146684.1 substrate-binding domain-containing protein [Mameliella alba]MCA0956956.1 substrate-binding domain-containing protein [Mameliella alba]